MSQTQDLRAQLRTLSIDKSQRPRASATGAKRTLRFLLAVLLIAAIGGGVFLAKDKLPSWNFSTSASGEADSGELRWLTVTARTDNDPPPVLTATGKIVSDHRVQVATKVSGQIVGLYFEQGDRVEKGKTLARIEDVIYRARRDQAAANLQQATANLEYQKVNFARVDALAAEANAKPIEYADAKRWLDEAEAQVKANQAALDFSQKALDDCEVVAPISGVVLERNVEVGDFVSAEGGRSANANAQFTTIADMSKLRVEVDVSELDIARIRRDMPCTVAPDARKERRYRGHVMWLDPGANYSKATVQVKVRILDPDEDLRIEGSAQVAFLSESPATGSAQADPTIWIPTTACQIDASGQGGAVFASVEGRLKKAQVQLGRRSGGQVEIVSGLVVGQSIAADGLEKLREGQRIRN